MELSDEHRAALVRFAQMFGHQEAEDLAHDALLRLLQARKDDPPELPLSYLRTTVRRLAIDRHRSRERTPDPASLESFPGDLL